MSIPLGVPAARGWIWPTPAEARARAKALFAPGRLLPPWLDGARGLAALLVLVFHLRTWLLVPYGEASGHGPLLAAFYLVSTFGHEAVIVFFVLSGFLIGGAVFRMESGAAGVRGYAAARVARIAPVLAGAVTLSVLAQAVASSWDPANTCRDPAATVVGNLLALGNLGVPPLCNNLPLWSLSNEVAYYLAFPTLVALMRGSRGAPVLACGALVVAIAAASLWLTPWDNQNVVLDGPLWLVGAALWGLPERRWPAWPGLALLCAGLAFGRTGLGHHLFMLADGVVALGFAGLLAALFGRTGTPVGGRASPLSHGLARVSAATAAISFSLYVVHNPVIGLFQAWAAGHGPPLPAAQPPWGALAGLVVAAIAVATLFSLVLERPHRVLARWLMARLAAGEA